MQDLTGRFTANLVPSSMCAGNTTADDRKYSMSAPGSDSILPVPDKMDNLPQPNYSGGQIPLGHPGQQEHVSVSHSRPGGAQWVEKESTAGGKWKVAP